MLYRAGNTGEVKKRKLLSVDFYAQLSENSRYSLLTLRGERVQNTVAQALRPVRNATVTTVCERLLVDTS